MKLMKSLRKKDIFHIIAAFMRNSKIYLSLSLITI